MQLKQQYLKLIIIYFIMVGLCTGLLYYLT